MFGTNEIVGAKFFRDAPTNSLFVTSVFYTLQGEGPYSGCPAVFVRLAKCNLACSFCDTIFDQGEWLTFDQLYKRIKAELFSYWQKQGLGVPTCAIYENPDYYGVGLVITGGEPTLQDNLVDFLDDASKKFPWVQIESNGIRQVNLNSDAVTVVISPKCAEDNGRPTKYLKPREQMLRQAHCLKFVMCAPTNADNPSPYESIPDWAFEWADSSGKQIFVSPMNVYKSIPKKMRLISGKTDKSIEERSTVDEVVSFWEPGVLDMEANQRNHEYTAKYAMSNGLRFQLQTHLYAGLA
jgi:organic radical activating enzyme